MSNALTSMTSLPVSPSAVALRKSVNQTEFLRRIQLVTKGKYVDKQLIAPGHYGSPGAQDTIQDLGGEIDVLVFAVRQKALDTTEDPPQVCYDEESDLYADIKTRAGEKDSGCMYGPSFLLFERNTGTFYEFFAGSKSARIEAAKFSPFLPVSEEQAEQFEVEAQGPQPMTLRSKYIERGRFAWHIPQVSACSTPFNNLPELEVIVAEMNKFLNPKVDGPEIVKEGEGRNV